MRGITSSSSHEGRRAARRAPWLASLCLLAGACYSGLDGIDANALGDDAGDGDGDGDGGGDDADADRNGECRSTPEVEEAKLRRLSRVEYENTLHDLGLLAADASILDAVPGGDIVIGGKMRGFHVGGTVDDALARDLVDTAMEIAATATADVDTFVGCTPTTSAEQDDCARDFIVDFGRRAYRRPLSDTEIDELTGVYADARATVDHHAGIEAVLVAMLVSPDFLYLVEHDPPDAAPGDVVEVGPFELASRLSYFLWDSTPDDALLDAAESGDIMTAQGLESQVRRMIADDKARGAVRRFLAEWSFVDGLPTVTKSDELYGWFSPELATDLRASFLATLEAQIWSDEPTLEHFLAPDAMFVNQRIAEAYDIAGVTGEELVAVPVDPEQRPGLLTHPAFLTLAAKASRGDPIARGLFVREQLLCADLPPPPTTDENGEPIDFDVPEPEPGVSNRDRFKEHTASPACGGCHALLDPIGFGFEHYDATGRFRDVDENGNPVDASGEVVAAGDLDGTFDGAAELVDRMSTSEHVAECVTAQWFRYGLGRREGPLDVCSTDTVSKQFIESGMDIQELFVALSTSVAFRHRQVGEK